MEGKEIKLINDKVLKNKRLGEIFLKYCFKISQKERGQFSSLIWESYNVGVEDGKRESIK